MDQVLEALAGLFSAAPERGLNCLGTLATLFGGQILAAVEQRKLESSQRSLVSQIARDLASSAQGVRAKAGGAIGSRHLALVAPPFVPPPPAPKGLSRALARNAAKMPLLAGACLQRQWQEWENIGACEWVGSAPLEFSAYREGLDHHSALDATVSEMLIEGVIELVVNPQAGFYSRVFLVPKSTGG
ncbi:hypothetical protein E2C01_038950 [Portunus trituberculatus]|uniref:Uncharacterized protein n=1 Tax=Portunus trituberculatus TaxID=210409 RepID=A0A5B7FIB3_PORTR|nr:hypothetical protein [Portunus trituberculatus]